MGTWWVFTNCSNCVEVVIHRVIYILLIINVNSVCRALRVSIS